MRAIPADRNPRSRIIRRGLAAALTLTVGGALAACGGGSGDSAGNSANGLEKARINVAGLAVVDDAPLYIARDRGLFRKQGLKVHVTTLTQSTQAIPGLLRGDIDIDAGGNYVSFFQAKAKGAIDLRVLANAFQCGKDVVPVLAMPGSAIRRPADLAGKKIAVNLVNNVQTMLLNAVLRADGVDVSKIKYVQVPFPNMAAALEKGQVDAASAVEPFSTGMKRRLHARKVVDSCTGPTKDFPLSGVFATDEFVKKNPKTVAAFQRAYRAAAKIAADRSVVERTLPGYTKIDRKTASAITIGRFPVTADPAALQKVADLMRSSGMLSKPLNAGDLLAK